MMVQVMYFFQKRPCGSQISENMAVVNVESAILSDKLADI